MFSSPGARSDCGQEPSALVPLSPRGEWQPRHLSSSQDSWIHLLNPHTRENTTSSSIPPCNWAHRPCSCSFQEQI